MKNGRHVLLWNNVLLEMSDRNVLEVRGETMVMCEVCCAQDAIVKSRYCRDCRINVAEFKRDLRKSGIRFTDFFTDYCDDDMKKFHDHIHLATQGIWEL